ncbi:MAG: aldehyde dehydrogenase EutE [Clostridium sp.]|nr:aldehyde dehydrogenase EutE [Clostridium sp.]
MENKFNKILKSGIFSSANDAVLLAAGAYKRYTKLSLNERQEIIDEIKAKLLYRIKEIAQMTVDETGMGNVNDKIKKLFWAITKTPGTEDLITEVKTGDNGMTLYELSSYGVICSILPCTNPCATLISNTIGMLAAGNSIIYCPHPRAINVSKYVTEIINMAIRDKCGIDNLVVTLNESSISSTTEIITHPDVSMVVCTGGMGVLKRAMSCGKKVIGAGPANPVSIVDETAKIDKAARDIVKGASFDNNLMCISEKCIVAVSIIADELMTELIKDDVYYVKDPVEMVKLTKAAITSDMKFKKSLEGKSADEILKAAGIYTDKKFKLIVVECIKEHPFVTNEMLMPMVPLVKVDNFEEALDTALEIEQGYRHTASIHSQSIERLNRAAKVMQTSVFVKNGASLVGIGVNGEGDASFTIATATGEGTTTARHFARRRRCSLTNGFSIR